MPKKHKNNNKIPTKENIKIGMKVYNVGFVLHDNFSTSILILNCYTGGKYLTVLI